MTVNKLKGETLIDLAGKQYKARLTMNSILQIESATGLSIIKLTQQMSEGDVMMNHVLEILTPALRGGGNDLQKEDVISLVEQSGIVAATRAVATLLASTLTEKSEDKAQEGKPQEGD